MSNPQGGKGNSLGLAIGATNLAGIRDGQRPVVRPTAVTLERGLVLTGFVDRVGDPVPMVAPDGSKHRSEMLLAEALDGMARTAANGAPVSETAVAVPAHWRQPVVDALRAALRSKPGLSRSPLVSDATAALTALRSNPGLPSAGVIVLCDFGGSGSSITLVDAAAKDAPIGETVRLPDFSGDHFDQAILTKVVGGVFEASEADPSGTAMVGSLTRLRDECRRAKERLSAETATAIVVDLPGLGTNVRMTRMELEGLIAGPLTEFLAALDDTLQRYRVPVASISAVATVGGGARIPLITQRLSEHLRATVVTTPHPQLTAADGVALIAHRSQVVETATTLTPTAPAAVAASAIGAGEPSTAFGALAWSEAEAVDRDEVQPYFGDGYIERPAGTRPELRFHRDDDEWEEEPATPRRVPILLFGLSAAAALIATLVFGLTAFSRETATMPVDSSTSLVPAPVPAAAVLPAPPAPAPEVTTVVVRPQQRIAPAPQRPVVQPAPQQPVTPPPTSEEATPEPEPEPQPEPEPDPQPEPEPDPTDPGTGTGTGGTGTGGTGTGTGGTGTGTGGTGTGTGGTGTGTGTGTGP